MSNQPNPAATMKSSREHRLLRLRDVLALLAIGRTAFLERVSEGVYPQPVRLGDRTVRWRLSDIAALIDQGARPA